ncbi:hypothetical protein A4G19_08460 [Pasteurellaceae bacterium Macca]|nr:hypothetical protein [Pasteurellaceae bacterium Macca]
MNPTLIKTTATALFLMLGVGYAFIPQSQHERPHFPAEGYFQLDEEAVRLQALREFAREQRYNPCRDPLLAYELSIESEQRREACVQKGEEK